MTLSSEAPFFLVLFCPFVQHDSWQVGESEGLGAKQLL